MQLEDCLQEGASRWALECRKGFRTEKGIRVIPRGKSSMTHRKGGKWGVWERLKALLLSQV